MNNHYLVYWKPHEVENNIEENPLFDHHPSNQLKKMKVRPGDTLWLVTSRGQSSLQLVGKLEVGRIVSQEEAERIFKPGFWEANWHAIARKDTATHLRIIDISVLAVQLRFNSDKKAHLPREFDGKNLQAMRSLTSPSVQLLENFWSGKIHAASHITRRTEQGGGYGSAEKNREVEQAAIAAVKESYKSRGWTVQSVEREKVGFDLCCTHKRMTEHAEVKGIQGDVYSFPITVGEIRRAQRDSHFVLWGVTSALRKPKRRCWKSDEFFRSFDLEPVQFRAKLRTRSK